jgi:hypothetical protein
MAIAVGMIVLQGVSIARQSCRSGRAARLHNIVPSGDKLAASPFQDPQSEGTLIALIAMSADRDMRCTLLKCRDSKLLQVLS